jgi:hypothetical protein
VTNYVWNGSNGDFDAAGDWSPNGVPTAGTDTADISSGTVQYTASMLSISSISLGSSSTSGTIDFSGGDAHDTLLSTQIGAVGQGATPNVVNITGELDMGVNGDLQGTYDGSDDSSLAVTLTPVGANQLGILLVEIDSDQMFVGAGGTLSISPDKASDISNVALVNDGEPFIFNGGEMMIGVPVYAQAGHTGFFDMLFGGTLTFSSSVANQTILAGDGASVIIDQPSTFDAALGPTLVPGPSTSTGVTYYTPSTLDSGVAIDLRGLAADAAAFVTTPQIDPAIELLNNGAATYALSLEQGLAGGLGVSLSPDGDGGTILRTDLSSDEGKTYLDPNALSLPYGHTNYAIEQGQYAYVVSSATLTDYITPQATLSFSDGTELFNANTTAAAVDRLCAGILGHDADTGGLNYWAGLTSEEGASLAQIATGILASPEFTSQPPLSDTGFVDQLYVNILGRPADTAGQAYWTNLLADGESRGAVAVGFTSSTEAISDDAARLAHGLFLGS